MQTYTLSLVFLVITSVKAFAQITLPSVFEKINGLEGNFTTLPAQSLFGVSVSTIGDLDQDGMIDVAVGARDFNGSFRGAVWILFMGSNKRVKSHVRIEPSDNASSAFGYSVRGIGDLDGDGNGDIAVGAPYDADGGHQYGAVWIVFLNQNGTVKDRQKISSTSGNFSGSLVALSSFGSSIAGLGDLDGDGNEDIAVGAYRDNSGTVKSGSVYILFLNANGTVKSHQKIGDSMGGFNGPLDFEDYFGIGVSDVSDLDGDGIPELAVGAHRDDDGFEDAGALWLLYLNANGTVKSSRKVSATTGDFTGVLHPANLFGTSVERTTDIDNNGIEDLIVGSSTDDDGGDRKGAIWILYLRANGTVLGYDKISQTAGSTNLALDINDQFGQSIASLGDVDGDHVLDIVVGAIRDDDGEFDAGSLWITAQTCPGSLADAGDDVLLCDGVYETTLNAVPPPHGTGSWTRYAGGGVIEQPSDVHSVVDNLTAGSNVFIWSVETGADCPVLRDTVFVTVAPSPSSPVAGQDKQLCGQFSTTLDADMPVNGTGRWSVIEGTAEVSNVNDPQATVGNLDEGKNVFLWEVSSMPYCETEKDSVVISVFTQPVADAGADKLVCSETTVQLDGVPVSDGSGTWQVLNGSATIMDPTDPKTTVADLNEGTISFLWAVSPEHCPSKTDTVHISVITFASSELPNVITPNGDDKNETFEIPDSNHLWSPELSIFNRWGQEVYHNSSYRNEWSGDELTGSVFYYFLTIKECNEKIKGWIHVLK